MPPLMIFYLFIVMGAAFSFCFALITLFFTPWFINPKFRGPLKERLQRRTGWASSDFFKYGTFVRTVSYAQAVLSEKSAQKYFGVSSQVFRSKLNRFEILLCYIALIPVPLFFTVGAIVFIAAKLGFIPDIPE